MERKEGTYEIFERGEEKSKNGPDLLFFLTCEKRRLKRIKRARERIITAVRGTVEIEGIKE